MALDVSWHLMLPGVDYPPFVVRGCVEEFGNHEVCL